MRVRSGTARPSGRCTTADEVREAVAGVHHDHGLHAVAAHPAGLAADLVALVMRASGRSPGRLARHGGMTGGRVRRCARRVWWPGRLRRGWRGPAAWRRAGCRSRGISAASAGMSESESLICCHSCASAGWAVASPVDDVPGVVSAYLSLLRCPAAGAGAVGHAGITSEEVQWPVRDRMMVVRAR